MKFIITKGKSMKAVMTGLMFIVLSSSAYATVEEFTVAQKPCVEVNEKLNDLTPFLFCKGIDTEGDDVTVCLSKEGKRKLHFKQVEADEDSWMVNQLGPKQGKAKIKSKYVRFSAKKVKEANILSKVTTYFDMDTATNLATLSVGIKPTFGGMLLGLEPSDSNYQLECQNITEFPTVK
jgi:hypothetical protein